MPYTEDPVDAPTRPGTSLSFDSTIEDIWTDPDGLLHRLRAEEPVHWSAPEQAWVLTRHADAIDLLRNDRTFSGDARLASGEAGSLVRGVAARSPLPYDSVLSSAGHHDHARLRRAAASAFAPASVDALREPIRALARELLEAARGDELDAIGQFAQPLSLGVTLHLLGLDVLPSSSGPGGHDDAARLTRLADMLMRASQYGPSAVAGQTSIVDVAAGLAAARAEIGALIDALSVADGSLLASLRAAREAGRLSNDDLVALVIFIATVGQAPTAFALGNALLALLRNADQLSALRADPALFAHLIDEAARFDPPVRMIRRFATEDTTFRGRAIHTGDQMQIVVTATNRDPAAFADPNRFDLRRGARNHLGFGWGNHHCLGAPVSRAIASEGFAVLLDAFPSIVASGRLELMTGETAGPTALGILGRPGTASERLEIARARDVASLSVPRVSGNHACPCGSGRKAKRCHATR